MIGLYRAECVWADSPFRCNPLRTLADVKHITADWAAWFNNQASCTAMAAPHQPKQKTATMPTKELNDWSVHRNPRAHQTRLAHPAKSLLPRSACG